MTDIEKLLSSCLFEIDNAINTKKLDDIKIAVLGKNGKLTERLKSLRNMPEDQRKIVGAEINAIKSEILKRIEAKALTLEILELEKKLSSEFIDVSMPARIRPSGCIHPLTKVTEEVANILSEYGFVFTEGPEIETEYYNFTALNIPDHHPARTMHDTFYVSYPTNNEGRRLLRTHTSPVQVRSMLVNNTPPFRYFSIGRVYRSDYDATHTPMFNQIEGLMVGKDISFSHLKYMMTDFLKKFFGVPKLELRLRPSFFPFTEPSTEIDINYEIKGGRILFGSGDKWMEVAGGGIVHPNVLKSGNVDPDQYQGFAFGFGLERLTSLKYGVSDLRKYFESDERWRNAFGFSYVTK
ncbi:MAG: phenylalanine--tRNA ligase subunit alpha [Alphaproteobacteria bacterium]|nr:phenylalanine--tRNA ligase subunit alpha [Alphaproteobacteria bacterium]